MLDYLYYKLYKATLKTSLNDIPEFAAMIYLGGVISINLLVSYLFLVKLHILPYIFTNKIQGSFLFVVVIFICGIVYGKKRRKIVFEKYSQESDSERVKGNIIVFSYIIVSFLLIFAIAYFRPGKL